MSSTSMLKRCAVLLVSLGVADLAWINFALGPRVLAPDRGTPVIVASVEAPAASAQDAPRPTAVPVIDKNPRAARSAIYFDSMSGRVNSAGRATLFEAARRARPRGVIHLEGHADYRGEADFNERLSKLRVDNAAAALVKQGFAAARIQKTHIGERDADEVAEADLWRDRRVDVWIEGGPE